MAVGDTMLRGLSLLWKTSMVTERGATVREELRSRSNSSDIQWQDAFSSLKTSWEALFNAMLGKILPAFTSVASSGSGALVDFSVDGHGALVSTDEAAPVDDRDAAMRLAALCSAHSVVLVHLRKCSERVEAASSMLLAGDRSDSDEFNENFHFIEVPLHLLRINTISEAFLSASTGKGQEGAGDTAETDQPSAEWFFSAVKNMTDRCVVSTH